MGTPAYNLVIVRGEGKELNEFAKKAFKNKSEAFCMEQLLPLPGYLAGKDEISDEVRAFRHTVYGSKWVAAFGILVEKDEGHLKYFFNSKYTKANLDYISANYNKLGFTHVFVEIEAGQSGIIEYANGESMQKVTIPDGIMNWHIASQEYTYLYIEELHHKFMHIRNTKPHIIKSLEHTPSFNQYDFFKIFDRTAYLRDHEGYYDALHHIELELDNKVPEIADSEIFYPFRTNDIYHREEFIKQNFLSPVKRNRYLKNLKNRSNENKSGQAMVE
jgi:hypothetical protein